MSEVIQVRDSINEIPPYHPGKPIEEVTRELGIKDPIKLASNENPLGPSKLALKAIKNTLKNVHLYPDATSYELKKRLATHLQVKESQLIIGNGSVEIAQMVAETFSAPHDEAIVGVPSFLKYKKVIHLANGKCVSVPLKNYTFDWEAILKAITSKTRVIYIANPNNPTGTIIKKDEVEVFLKELPKEIIVVFDEAYYDYVNDPLYPQTIPYVEQNKNVVILRTFSKIYGLAGLRMGYGIAREEIINYLERVRETFNTNTLGQMAACAALDDEQHVEESKKVNQEGLAYLETKLTHIKIPFVPSQANFIFMELPFSAQMGFRNLLLEGVIVRPMDFYGLPNSIRVTVGTKMQNEKFIRALQKILRHPQEKLPEVVSYQNANC